MIKCIDFDEKFGKYAEGWIAANRSKYKNMDLLEEQIPEVYLRWLNTPADWLDGKTPGEWFNQFEDANELVELMRAYQKAKINMPDPLLERVTDLGEDAVAPLMQLVKEYDNDRGLAISALNLLIELGSSEPMEMCLDIISKADGQNELTDVASSFWAAWAMWSSSQSFPAWKTYPAPPKIVFWTYYATFRAMNASILIQ